MSESSFKILIVSVLCFSVADSPDCGSDAFFKFLIVSLGVTDPSIATVNHLAFVNINMYFMRNYQLGVSPAVQYEVFRLQVSVYDAFGMQVGEGFNHTGRVEPGSRIFKRTPETQRVKKNETLTERRGLSDLKCQIHWTERLSLTFSCPADHCFLDLREDIWR